ncbi:hypothetical protein SHAb15599_00056 [Acinetobacter phage SH-Ab 15599]|nr:hypothetical protein SHAb15599_00056 [Acinetobacter phage SH-Ab 15599]
MGGKAFVGLERLSTAELRKVERMFKDLFGYTEIMFPRNFVEKEDHGDVDCFIIDKGRNKMKLLTACAYSHSDNPDMTLWRSPIEDFMKDNDRIQGRENQYVQFINEQCMLVKMNAQSGRMYSVDAQFFNESEINFARCFYSYGMASQILQRMVEKYNLSLKPDGLYYTFTTAGKKHETLILNNWYQFLNIFELEHLPYYDVDNSFNNHSDFFRWLYHSPYCRKDVFDFKSQDKRQETKLFKDFNAWLNSINWSPRQRNDLTVVSHSVLCAVMRECPTVFHKLVNEKAHTLNIESYSYVLDFLMKVGQLPRTPFEYSNERGARQLSIVDSDLIKSGLQRNKFRIDF